MSRHNKQPVLSPGDDRLRRRYEGRVRAALKALLVSPEHVPRKVMAVLTNLSWELHCFGVEKSDWGYNHLARVIVCVARKKLAWNTLEPADIGAAVEALKASDREGLKQPLVLPEEKPYYQPVVTNYGIRPYYAPAPVSKHPPGIPIDEAIALARQTNGAILGSEPVFAEP